MTKKAFRNFRGGNILFWEKLENFSQTLKYFEKRGKSEIRGKCIIGFVGGFTPLLSIVLSTSRLYNAIYHSMLNSYAMQLNSTSPTG